MISLIVAMGSNRVIGRDGRIPWRMPADMRRFREVTMGKAILMGRVTHESIGRPLDGRHNIVLTRNRDYQAQGCTVVNSVEEALAAAGGGEVMVIGGALLYEQLLPAADRIYLTLIDAEYQGDSYFPRIRAESWPQLALELNQADERNPHNYAFIILQRRTAAR
ncbi:MAG: type 3 dihydrofolate reductase [Chloroflexota bacterium]|nr:MAG: type 3 dihydrofolate reductase [Chloroflexota bacterium]